MENRYNTNSAYGFFVLMISGCNTAASVEPRLFTPAPIEAVESCEPSYPDVCIPIVSYDLDCKDIPHRNFAVTGSDPHNFDGDRDGIGCERYIR